MLSEKIIENAENVLRLIREGIITMEEVKTILKQEIPKEDKEDKEK